MTELMKKITKQDIRNTLALIIVIGCFAFIFSLLKRPIPVENKDVVNILAGTLFGTLAAVAGYYYGQSKTEADLKKRDTDNGPY
jgi:drug/metabolite transporter (DMT)-like permease